MNTLPQSRLRSAWTKLNSGNAVNQTGLVTVAFGFEQVLRLMLNVILAHLLVPAIFGVMALINTLRTGVELLTDMGLRQNVIISPDGEQSAFFNTAWTLQVIRGAILMVIMVVAAWPLSVFYGRPELFLMLVACSTMFLITSLSSPGTILVQRRREVGKLAVFDLVSQVIGAAISLAFALLMPTVWGTIWALLLSAALIIITSHIMMPERRIRLMINREHAWSIVHFGKWIFFSSLVYFGATNFDRLYLPTVIPIALFGVYGIARVVGDAATGLMHKIGGFIILPAVARLGENMQQQLPRITRIRRLGFLVIGFGIGCAVAFGDLFVGLLYDPRYAAAQLLLPLLLMGTWFAVQSALADSTLLGLGKPQYAAVGNLSKLIWSVVLLPLTIAQWGLFAGMIVIAMADVPRYLTLLIAQKRCGLHFALDDLMSALVVGATAWLVRLGLIEVGAIDHLVTAVQWREMSLLMH